jgi:hypothetical protein
MLNGVSGRPITALAVSIASDTLFSGEKRSEKGAALKRAAPTATLVMVSLLMTFLI